jgi:hypothetical protein
MDLSMELAFEAGISLNEYYDLTPVEFGKFVIGYRNRIRKQYEQARFMAYFTIKPHLDKKDSRKNIDEIIPFEWERKNGKKMIKMLSEDEVKELQNKFNFF